MSAINERMETLAGDRSDDHLSAAEQREFDTLSDEFRDLNKQRERVERAAALAGPGFHREAGSAQPITDRMTSTARDAQHGAGMRSLDAAVSAGRLDASGAEIVERIMSTGPTVAQSWSQRYAVAAGSPAYERAFAKLLTGDPARAHLTWTPEEGEAYRVVEGLRQEQRGLTTDGGSAGAMIPLTLDPTVLLTSAGSINPLRAISRVVQTATNAWQGVTSAGSTAEWIGEAGEVADASPTFASPSIPVYKGDVFVPYSFEAEMDALGFAAELGKILADAADQLTATAYTTGAGSTQPKGIITALIAASPSVVINSGTANTVKSSDAYALQNALPPRFQAGAQWAANIAILNTLRQQETTNGALAFPSLQNTPPTLLGRPANELSNMDGTIETSLENYALLYGRFDNFVIVDRIGSTLEIVPHIFGASRRPTGQRGALLWFRTGSDVVVPQAFRLLDAT